MMAYEEPEPYTNGDQDNHDCALSHGEDNGSYRVFHLNLESKPCSYFYGVNLLSTG